METTKFEERIGNTALEKVESLSKITGCDIFVKREENNPGGSIKDRAALSILKEAERLNLLSTEIPTVIEASAGNTAMALCMLAKEKGYHCIFYAPASVSSEKILALEVCLFSFYIIILF